MRFPPNHFVGRMGVFLVWGRAEAKKEAAKTLKPPDKTDQIHLICFVAGHGFSWCASKGGIFLLNGENKENIHSSVFVTLRATLSDISGR